MQNFDCSIFNFSGVVVALFCFIMLVIVILRLNEGTLLQNLRNITICEDKIESHSQAIQNPFNVQLSADSGQLEISLQKPCMMYIYWGTVISEFYSAIQRPWIQILEDLKTGIWLKDHTLFINNSSRLKPGKYFQIFKKPPEVTGENLGQRPRNRYPAVVITVQDNIVDDTSSIGSYIVAMFSVLHVQDTICNNETHIMYQYIKTNDDRVTTLQPLFMSSTNEDADDTTPLMGRSTNKQQEVTCQTNNNLINSVTNTETSEAAENNSALDYQTECVVCQHNRVTVAILPCRHACICDNCLQKLDKCPMCRGYLVSYFRLKDCQQNTVNFTNRLPNDIVTDTDHESRWEYINRKLNEFLGFQ